MSDELFGYLNSSELYAFSETQPIDTYWMKQLNQDTVRLVLKYQATQRSELLFARYAIWFYST